MISDFETWVHEALQPAITDEWIAALATKLAESGRKLDLAGDRIADVPSTGGPSSLTTLICPLYLRASGFVVPKLAVPGRPAGGLDALAQIDGYRTRFGFAELSRLVESHRYVHFEAASEFAPLDDEFFSYRQRTNSQALWPLVIASLLAKKMAVSIKSVSLDIRVSKHGNFGHDPISARVNAKRFIEVARILDINAKCYLTDGNNPRQPYLGRSESLWALFEIFESSESAWLAEHHSECRFIASGVTGQPAELSRNELAAIFYANVDAQGGSRSAFLDQIDRTRQQHQIGIVAERSGRLSYDLGHLRAAIVEFQGAGRTGEYADEAGVVLLAPAGSLVDRGAPLMSVRCTPARRDQLIQRLGRAVLLSAPKGEDSVELIDAG